MDEIQQQIDDINSRLDDNDSSLQDFSDNLDNSLDDINGSIDDINDNVDELQGNEGQLLFPLNQDTIDLINEQTNLYLGNYGEMWFHNDVSFYTQALTKNTPAKIACFDTADNGQQLFGFNYTTSSLVCQNQGTYRLSWNISLGSSTSNNKHHIWLAINGVEQLSTENHCKPVNSSDVIACSGGAILPLNVGDIVTLWVNDESGNETLTVYSSNVSINKLGN